MISSPGRRPAFPSNHQPFHPAPNAALLIDFDNVTMGIRSDLGKELKALLNSEVIRGKVAVQRAYADWRRYPQYIVPLAESSIDLIFAPAYGSSKKNATDLRMAIDAMELVFIRPEIGTFILMTGDSDFSSCVLKLKEYGKYVIGVGMRESSSDLLIQNCDEYYSYHSLSGLTRAGEEEESKEDPWTLVKRAVQQMTTNGDVMRTDRLKQVMLSLDPAFDEKKIGYSKFSRFVSEAAGKGLLRLRKGENGQYEIAVDGEAAPAVRTPAPRAEAAPAEAAAEAAADRGRRRGRPAREEARPAAAVPERQPAAEPAAAAAPAAPPAAPAAPAPQPRQPETPAAVPVAAEGQALELGDAYRLLQQAVRALGGAERRPIRDGDVKRKMIELAPGFDETALGFSKFTRFLRQAHDAEVIDLNRANGGNYEVTLPAGGQRLQPLAAPAAPPAAPAAPAPRAEEEQPVAAPAAVAPSRAPRRERGAAPKPAAAEAPAAEPAPAPAAAPPAAAGAASRPGAAPGALRGRRGGRVGAPEGPPPLLPGQVVRVAGQPAPGATEAAPAEAPDTGAPAGTAAGEEAAKKKPTRRGRRGRGGQRAEAEAAAVAEAAAPEAVQPAAEPETPAPAEASEAAPAPAAPKQRRARGRAPAKKAAAPAVPTAAPAAPAPAREAPAAAPAGGFSPAALGLPRGREAVEAYLTAYPGVGKKTAETLWKEYGPDLFATLHRHPERLRALLGDRRAGALIEQWDADYARRADDAAPAPVPAEAEPAAPEPAAPAAEARPAKKTRRGGRGRGTKK